MLSFRRSCRILLSYHLIYAVFAQIVWEGDVNNMGEVARILVGISFTGIFLYNVIKARKCLKAAGSFDKHDPLVKGIRRIRLCAIVILLRVVIAWAIQTILKTTDYRVFEFLVEFFAVILYLVFYFSWARKFKRSMR